MKIIELVEKYSKWNLKVKLTNTNQSLKKMNSTISHVSTKNKDCIPIDVLNWNVYTRNVHHSIQSHQLQIGMQIVLDKVFL